MTTSQIVAEAKKRTEQLRAVLNAEIVRKLTIAEIAVIVDGMDDSTAASVRIMRLNDAIYQVNADFAAYPHPAAACGLKGTQPCTP